MFEKCWRKLWFREFKLFWFCYNFCSYSYDVKMMTSLPVPGLPRELTEEERTRLEKDVPVSDFKREKLERESGRNWDLFYKRNTDHFFKDRHWLTREFPILLNKVLIIFEWSGKGIGQRDWLYYIGLQLFPTMIITPQGRRVKLRCNVRRTHD